MQWRWCALHRIINTKQTASIRCISTQINGMQVYIIHSDISMNKYIYKVRFVYILRTKSMRKHELLNNKQFNYNYNNRKNDCKQVMK